ncbi:MAG: purine-binding chemotaxis protein CheW, partial [Planctomycetes bacterium]|nr:purine-binding chemotaxis protein CheW [Planctomycetota bacterium]
RSSKGMASIQSKSSQIHSSSISTLGEDARKERREAAQKFQQYVGFILDEQEYAIPIEKIQEIVLYNGVTRLPQVPPFVEGVTNLRGNIIPILNLRVILGMANREINPDTRVVVVHVQKKTVGLIVDSVTQVKKVNPQLVQSPESAIAMGASNHIAGLTKENDHLLILLDIEKMMQTINVQEAIKQG